MRSSGGLLISFALVAGSAGAAWADAEAAAPKALKLSASRDAIAATGPHASMDSFSAPAGAGAVSAASAETQWDATSAVTGASDIASARLSSPLGRESSGKFDLGGLAQLSASPFREQKAVAVVAFSSQNLQASGSALVRSLDANAARMAPVRLRVRAPDLSSDTGSHSSAALFPASVSASLRAAWSRSVSPSIGEEIARDDSPARSMAPLIRDRASASASGAAHAPTVEASPGKLAALSCALSPEAVPDRAARLAPASEIGSDSGPGLRVATVDAPVANASDRATIASGAAASPALAHRKASAAPAKGLWRAAFAGKSSHPRRPLGY